MSMAAYCDGIWGSQTAWNPPQNTSQLHTGWGVALRATFNSRWQPAGCSLIETPMCDGSATVVCSAPTTTSSTGVLAKGGVVNEVQGNEVGVTHHLIEPPFSRMLGWTGAYCFRRDAKMHKFLVNPSVVIQLSISLAILRDKLSCQMTSAQCNQWKYRLMFWIKFL